MRVVKPIPITDTNLIYSSVPEEDYLAWDESVEYDLGDRIVYKHVVYECVQEPSEGHEPDEYPLFWAPLGPTNCWKMFDAEVGTQTVAEGQIEVTVESGIIDGLALLNIKARTAEITMTDGHDGPVVYNKVFDLERSIVYDWYEYFFFPFEFATQLLVWDLPPYSTGHITVNLTGEGDVRCGSMIIGSSRTLGEDFSYGATAGIMSFSRKDTNPNTGAATLIKRRNSRRVSGQFMVDAHKLNSTYQLLTELDAEPCLWVGVDSIDYEPFTVYGFYRDFSIIASYPSASLCDLDIEGLV